MKDISPAALAALARGAVIVSGAVHIATDPAVLWWGGHGELSIGEDTYVGIGDRGLVSVTAGSLGGAEQGAELSLSGLEPSVLELLDTTGVRGAFVVLRRLIFDATGANLLDASVYLRGRIDELPIEEAADGTVSIKARVEGAARGLGRAGGRMRSNADQLMIDPNDDGFRKVTYAGDLMLYWGGRRPVRAGTGLPGTGGGSGGGRTGWVNRDIQIV